MSDVVKRAEAPNLWEIWNEWSAEIVHANFNPSNEELEEICKQEGWLDDEEWSHLKKYIHVSRDTHLYEKE